MYHCNLCFYTELKVYFKTATSKNVSCLEQLRERHTEQEAVSSFRVSTHAHNASYMLLAPYFPVCACAYD